MDRRMDRKRKSISFLRRLRRHPPEMVLFALAGGLAVLWFGPGAAILMLPFALLGFLLIADRRRPWRNTPRAGADRLRLLRGAIDDAFDHTRKTPERFACILARIDDPAGPLAPGDQPGADRVKKQGLARLARVVRREDALFDLSAGRVAVLLSPGIGLDRTAVLSIAQRVQTALAEGDAQRAGALRLSASLGVCLDDALTDRSGRAMIAAVEDVVAQAARDGSSAIRFHGEAPPS